MSNGRIFDSRIIGPHTADHHLTGIYANPHEDRQSARLAQRVRVASDSVLQFERGVDRALRMVFVRDRGAEQGEDSVTGGLHDTSIETADHLDHKFEDRIDQPAGIFGIQRLQEIH